MPKKQAKSRQELTFLTAAVLMLIVLVVSISSILGFLIARLNMAINPNILQPPAVVQFNINGFKNLGLLSAGTSATNTAATATSTATSSPR